jgi:hypothetical protein
MQIAREGCSLYLSGLILGHLVLCVLSAVLALTVGASCLWDVDLGDLLLASILRCCFFILFLHHAPVTRICISPEALVFHFSTSTILHSRRVCGVFPGRSIELCRNRRAGPPWLSTAPASSSPFPMTAINRLIYIPS